MLFGLRQFRKGVTNMVLRGTEIWDRNMRGGNRQGREPSAQREECGLLPGIGKKIVTY